MKLQAIEDCDQHITSYTYTDTEYEDSDIRIKISATEGAPEGQLVRCNMMYAIKTIAILQLSREHRYGAHFIESYDGQLLYSGVLDSKHGTPSPELTSNSSADPSETVAQEKRGIRTSLLDRTNSTTSIVTLPGTNDVEYKIDFVYPRRGYNLVPKIHIFSAIIEMMMTLAERDSADAIQNVSQATSVDSLWIFVMHESASRFSLQVFELLAILESLARNAVSTGRYQEMAFKFSINREVVSRGCITMPDPTKVWCQESR